MKKTHSSLILKISVSLFFLNIIFLPPCFSQSSITKQVINGQYTKHTIDNLIPYRPDKYNMAVNDQLGVIGNNFFGPQVLNNSQNDNDWEKSATPTDYLTVYRPGPKMTFCGKVIQQEYSDNARDDDLNIQIVCNPKNPAFEQKYTQIKDRGRNLYPWAMIEGEIDINSASQKFFNPNNSELKFPIVNKTDVCLYGPWVEELYDPSEDINPSKDHADVHEIHPAEQFWWAEKTQGGFQYYLNAANDASRRFEESKWISNETKNIFAIAFDINKRLTDKIFYQIINVCNEGTTTPIADGKKHFLIFGSDTLIQVEEPPGADIMSISFVEVGLDPYALLKDKSDSVIKGFLILQSTIKNPTIGYGNLKLIIDKKRISKVAVANEEFAQSGSNTPVLQGSNVGASMYKRIKVTLKEITTLENIYTGGIIPSSFNLSGYIYIEKTTDDLPLSKSSEKILEDKPQLLFPLSPNIVNNRVIKHDLGVTGIGVKKSTYNNSVYLFVLQNDKINIITDFEAAFTSSIIRTLELVEQKPYFEMRLGLSELQKNVPLTKEIFLYNTDRNRKYKMKIKIECLLMD